MPETPTSVLVVDDYAPLRQLLTSFLSVKPGVCLWGTAESAEDALRQLSGAASPPDVVVTDLSMPAMSGIALAREIHERWAALPCIVFSAQDAQVFGEEARAAGVVAYVEKPRLAELVEEVRAQGRQAASREPVRASNPVQGAGAGGRLPLAVAA